MTLLAAYIAQSGARYEDDTHAGCLFLARDSGEPECANFPHGDCNVRDMESRCGFVAPNGLFLTRDNTMALFGFELAEDQCNPLT